MESWDRLWRKEGNEKRAQIQSLKISTALVVAAGPTKGTRSSRWEVRGIVVLGFHSQKQVCEPLWNPWELDSALTGAYTRWDKGKVTNPRFSPLSSGLPPQHCMRSEKESIQQYEMPLRGQMRQGQKNVCHLQSYQYGGHWWFNKSSFSGEVGVEAWRGEKEWEVKK